MHTKLVDISPAGKMLYKLSLLRKSIIIINTYEFDTVILFIIFSFEFLIKHYMCIKDFLWFVHKIIKL